ncbi:MAG: serine hydrolase [Saprospiraceae bacterium]|nr:serine hydrolase [Saprospiraceae bacterium]
MVNSMSLDEKIGQLFIVRSFSNENEIQKAEVINTIVNYGVGGVCLFKGTVPSLIQRLDTYQLVSKWPLMMSMDAEWGLGMRMTDIHKFPKQFCLGALTENSLIYHMAYEMGRQMKTLGIHMNFAPVADINNNLLNPVINERSFGSNRIRVSAKSFAYMQGLQDAGVMACLKHFPGHGDTEVDSHKDLPVLPFSKTRLDSIELFPFSVLSHLKPAAMMVGHLHIPQLDSLQNMSATLSPNITQNILRNEMSFDGLVITDALEMEGVTKHFSDGEIALRAFKAGNDMLLLSRNISEAITALKNAIVTGEISITTLDEKVKRILKAKIKSGLFLNRIPNRPADLLKTFNKNIEVINESIYRKAICLGKDPEKLVPIRKIPPKLLTIKLGNGPADGFINRLKDYASIVNYTLEDTAQWNDSLLNDIENAELIVIHVHGLNFNAQKGYGLNLWALQKLNPHIRSKKCIVVLFGCPYVSMYFPGNCSVVLAHEENEMSLDITAQMLFGTDAFIGVSPISVSTVLQEGKGIFRPSLMRLGYSIPEVQGMNSDSLQYIDTIAYELIAQKAAPGCQIVVARNNKVIYEKAFGYLDYDSTVLVKSTSLYDLASLTKVVCTAPILFQLEDNNAIKSSSKFSEFFDSFKNSNKEQLNFKDFMLHQGRMLSWIPYYKSTLPTNDSSFIYNPLYYDSLPSKIFNIPICKNLYLRNDYIDTILQTIIDSRVLDERKCNYSDLGFYFIPKLVHKLTGKTFERYYQKEIAEKLELRNSIFNPLSKGIDLHQIAPTEIDQYWRKQRIQGYVHDMGAAMMGGVAGHAGLFSNALDVVKTMQLYLNRGQYAGIELLKASDIGIKISRDREFLRRAQFFDMPSITADSIRPYVSAYSSRRSYGHQGFTGTCAWVDPDAQINYVFLSNRTFPNAEINKLHKERYRTRIQDIIYNAILPDQKLQIQSTEKRSQIIN